MTVMIFGAGCSSTRKARDWFKNQGIDFVERNIIKDPLTVNELQAILRMTIEGTEEIISTRSKTYKDMNLDIDALPLQQLLEFIHEHPRLLRSPIIIDEKRFQVGFHADDIRQFLPRETRERQWLKWRLNDLQVVKG